jgi:hypothetical protein
MKIKEVIEALEAGKGTANFSRVSVIEILKDLDGYIELNNQDLIQVVKTVKELTKIQNPYRTITCTVTIGKSKEESLIVFSIKDFIRIEDSKLILSNDDRRLKLSPGQIGCIERQLSGESKI